MISGYMNVYCIGKTDMSKIFITEVKNSFQYIKLSETNMKNRILPARLSHNAILHEQRLKLFLNLIEHLLDLSKITRMTFDK